jgi:sporulation protein YtfJ
MEEHPIQGLMTTAMENLKDMIEVNTIIGDPVESPDGSVIIPVSKVGFGFAAGGTEFMPSGSGSQGDSESSGGSSEAVFPFGGGSGGGVSITPVAFLIVSPKGIKMVHLDENTHIYEKIIDFAPKAVEKIQQLLKESNSGKGSKGEDPQRKDKEHSKKQEKEKDGDKGNENEKDKDSEGEKENGKSESDDSTSIYDI